MNPSYPLVSLPIMFISESVTNTASEEYIADPLGDTLFSNEESEIVK